jgi:hypothetical protein
VPEEEEEEAIFRHVSVTATTIFREDNTTDQKHGC